MSAYSSRFPFPVSIQVEENLIEPVVVLLEGLVEHGKPLIHGVDAGLGEAPRALRSLHTAHDESGILEHLQMLRDGGLGHLEGFGEFHHGGFAFGQASEDGAAGRISQSSEGGVKVASGCHISMTAYINNCLYVKIRNMRQPVQVPFVCDFAPLFRRLTNSFALLRCLSYKGGGTEAHAWRSEGGSF